MRTQAGTPRGEGRRVCLVVSRFNQLVTERLADGAKEALLAAGVSVEDVDVVWVPGAFELPQGVRMIATRGYDAIVAIGCVIRGETPHFNYICEAATHGLIRIAADSGVPIGFGVLTTDTMEQAMQRAGGAAGNKGADAAMAALEMSDLHRQLR